MSLSDVPPVPCKPCGDALAVLAGGHEQTRALADDCRRFSHGLACHRGADADMRRAAETLCRAMRRLAALEEELFYPAARGALEASSVVELAALEHATARQIIRQMQAADPRGAHYEALLAALVDCVERHARHEECELFPRLRASRLDLDALGERLARRRHELEEAY
jgi:hemerythrin-like domain-containing protein